MSVIELVFILGVCFFTVALSVVLTFVIVVCLAHAEPYEMLPTLTFERHGQSEDE